MTYDERFAAIAPMRDTLHLLTRAILGDLPADARILCVGAGTGLELLDLARAFPRWRFTAVEPATPMLNRCREKAAEAGVASRCTFHEGYLDSLPPAEPFDGRRASSSRTFCSSATSGGNSSGRSPAGFGRAECL